MSKVDLAFALKQPPEKAMAYFESLGLKLHEDWRPLEFNARERAFMVTNVGRRDVLQDIYNEVGKYIEGGTMRDAKKNLEQILTAKGWWGKGMVFDTDGVAVGRKLNPRRLDIILRQNKINAFAAARYQKLLASKATRPWWRYNTRLDNKVRASHRVLHGLMFRVDDAFWDGFYPPIDWLCRCFVTCHSERDIDREGWRDELRDTNTDGSLNTWEKYYQTRLREPKAARVVTYTDPVRKDFEMRGAAKVTTGVGFGNNAARDWLRPFVPQEAAEKFADIAALPKTNWRNMGLGELPLHPVSGEMLLPKGLTEIQYAQAFLAEFGATLGKGVVFKDAAGNALPIGVDLLINRKRGTLKADKRGRGPFLKILADTIKNPEEIWTHWIDTPYGREFVTHYVKGYSLDLGDRVEYGFAVFKLTKDGWYGATVFPSALDKQVADKLTHINDQRLGVLLYKK